MFDHQDLYEKILFDVFGEEIQIQQIRLVAAGNQNQAIYIQTDRSEFFVKSNYQSAKDIFEKEALALEMLFDNCSLKIPKVFGYGKKHDLNYLITEWIATGKKSSAYWEKLGHGIAQLHMVSAKTFGLHYHNYISILPQNNTPQNTWVDFFIHERLEPMIGKAFYDGVVDKKFYEKFKGIYTKLPDIFPKEIPALLHGDLWSGNIMVSSSGQPVLLDPAIYFGHREVDLAFSKLFGGFDQRFYDAYQEVYPLEPNFEQRIKIYNLYPLLVHLNLFGKSYLSPIDNTVKHLVS